jgi:hypothetical protein
VIGVSNHQRHISRTTNNVTQLKKEGKKKNNNNTHRLHLLVQIVV